MTDLVTYLLQERHRIPNQVIIDCLVLARLKPSPSRRIPQTEMQEMLGTCNQSHLSHRLTRLKQAGLIDYEAGVRGEPGYCIFRVGPAVQPSMVPRFL
jgi:DNA-binding HxlR family transcriptional regulator